MMKVNANSDHENNIQQIDQEKLSPIDYKIQAFLTVFLGIFGASDFYAGNNLHGYAKCGATIFINQIIPEAPFPFDCLLRIIQLVSVIQLSNDQYTDANGKIIRQIVQLKKEEISSLDQKIVLILCCTLGLVGAHQFYAGKPLKGILMLCSFGGMGIWTLINIYQLATCSFTDGEGKLICPDHIRQTSANNSLCQSQNEEMRSAVETSLRHEPVEQVRKQGHLFSKKVPYGHCPCIAR